MLFITQLNLSGIYCLAFSNLLSQNQHVTLIIHSGWDRSLDVSRSYILRVLIAVALCGCAAFAQTWQPLGPDGGTVRSLAFDPSNPDRIFLGTSAGRLYLSTDAGRSWSRFAHLGSSSEMVLDHIVIDPSNPRNIYVSAWNAQSPQSDGELFRSSDAGRTWDIAADLHGKSIRALGVSASNSKVLVAGALDGIYRSRDGGDNWERISPENHAEIRNVESIAIDPKDPDVIYAGTWHLPWKTEDGGKTWHNIKKGVIDDSDVFSIIVDSLNTSVVYVSACSGIYRSDSAGQLFRKMQGIPYSARRTRMLKMDPTDHNIVYAGTTEGLWKTSDAGASWKRMTATSVVINDVLVDPRRPNRVMLATDRSGVLLSDDGGANFTASNRGFSHRQVSALLVDRRNASTIYAGILNDKEFGGVFTSSDAGSNWRQISDGLDGRDVFVLRQLSDNSLLSGTDRGIFELAAGESRWRSLNNGLAESVPPASTPRTRAAHGSRPPATSQPVEVLPRVTGLEVTAEKWYAATSAGLFITGDRGQSWRREPLPNFKYITSLAAADKLVVVAARNAIAVSVNGGETWLTPKPLDPDFIINSVSLDSNGAGTIWLAAREGIFRSTDLGDTWKRINSLRLSNVSRIEVDSENQRLLATGAASSNVFESTDNGRTWNAINSGWLLRSVRPVQGRLFGTTPFDGVIMQPQESIANAQSAASGGNR